MIITLILVLTNRAYNKKKERRRHNKKEMLFSTNENSRMEMKNEMSLSIQKDKFSKDSSLFNNNINHNNN